MNNNTPKKPELINFTPLFDVLTSKYGLITSAIFGRIWRFCQMTDGVCKASLDTLAEHLNLNRATVMRRIKILVSDGYLDDLTPGLRNHPHIYRDTGKAKEESVALSNTKNKKEVLQKVAVTQSQAGVAESNGSVAQSNAGVAESNSHSNLKSLEERKVSKIESQKSIKDTAFSKEKPYSNSGNSWDNNDDYSDDSGHSEEKNQSGENNTLPPPPVAPPPSPKDSVWDSNDIEEDTDSESYKPVKGIIDFENNLLAKKVLEKFPPSEQERIRKYQIDAYPNCWLDLPEDCPWEDAKLCQKFNDTYFQVPIPTSKYQETDWS
jgi:hypothetical protein